jgi:hypothetical protein
VDELPGGQLYRVVVEQHTNGLVSSGAIGKVDKSPYVDAPRVPELYVEWFGSSGPLGHGPVTIGSDGSYKNGRGTASWVVMMS